jgi:hypothetical protein
MLGSCRRSGFSELGRYLGDTSDDLDVLVDDLNTPATPRSRELAAIALGLVAQWAQ